ncbi:MULTISPECIES: terminase small subunit [Pseudomonas]|uniref:terminase small subunit n=1 Tax=Pseudomonas TaxID=286 RepID=UPI00049A7853|nr:MULTISPECIES: terminase small subunit [Pseudomonas]AHZ77246.1 Phage terminase, small subunit [Pseudomonas putida]MDG9885421.1 terminase small subunit [Pseudomonas sp. GD04058]QUN70171.1 terminase small subunit [Pseudomonas sp. JS425]
MALTAKQQRFVDEYLKDLNATQAAIRAGYSKKTAASIGQENLRKPEIEKALRSATQERSKRTAITQDYVLSGIVEVVERCRQVAPVLDRSGEQILVETPTGELAPAFEFDAKNVLKGLELLGKHLNLFAEKDALDIELKRLEVEKRKAEIKRLQDGGGDDGLTPQRVEVIVRDARKPDADA